jgi:hypothetical protein
MQFSASFDRTTKIISGLVCLILLAVVIVVHNFVAAVLSLFVLAMCVAYSPRRYVLDGRSILIKRLAGTVRISLDDLREIRRATPHDFRGCIRLWGSGGLFGYYGIFSTDKLGKSTWYVTNRANSIVLITTAKTVLISPNDADAFLRAVQPAVPKLETYPAPAFDAPPRSSGLAKIAVIAVTAAVLGLVAVAMSYSPGPPTYTLTNESLTIHDRFYPVTLHASGVDLTGLRIIDLNQNAEWRPTRRTNGFANPHYQSGWFQVANGEKVRLYSARGSRLVLLPAIGGGEPVLYQAEDPDAFLRELRAAWGVKAACLSPNLAWLYRELSHKKEACGA